MEPSDERSPVSSGPQPPWVVPVSIDAPPAAAAGRPPPVPRRADQPRVSSQTTTHQTKSEEAAANLPPNAPPVHVARRVHDRQPSVAVRMSHRLLNWPGWHGLPSLMMKAALLSHETLEEVKDDGIEPQHRPGE